MKLDRFLKTVAATAAGLVLAACGGGGGSVPAAQAAASLQLSGSAATGAALANAQVDVKCAKGNGTTTTTAAGGYSVSISGGTLPCVVKVSGATGNGTAIVLHSVAQGGSADGAGNTKATANVTPITELILARLAGQLPETFFSNFSDASAGQVTADQLKAAVTAVTTALKNAGIDLGSIDPFQSELVPATNGTQGNDYDKLLDQLAGNVPADSLSQLVNQVANSQGDTGLADALVAVSQGSLQGCPSALSGKYRTLDYGGRTVVRQINFRDDTFTSSSGGLLFITAGTEPCTFTVDGMNEDGAQVHFDVVMGPNGVGAYRKQPADPAASTVGFLFPVQNLPYSALAGNSYLLVHSGIASGIGYQHFPAQVSFDAAAQKATPKFCDTGSLTAWNCVADPQSPELNLMARDDGGLDMLSGTMLEGQLYGYRTADGSLALFGTHNPDGVTDGTMQQLSIVGTPLKSLALPAVNTTTASTSLQFNVANGVVNTPDPVADNYTITAADAATGTVTRTRNDGRVETLHFNQPLTGLRYREAGANFAAIDQVPLAGLGMTLSINAAPSTSNTHLYVISVKTTAGTL